MSMEVESAVKESPKATQKHDAGRVLIVDDEAMLLRALRQILMQQGYEVDSAEHPTDALGLIAAHAYDVALLDLRMPGMTGIDLLERLKIAQPGVEVVMMTAYGTIEDAFRAVRLGAFNFLKKPFDNIDEVALVVQNALDRKRLRDRNRFLEGRLDLSERFEELVGRSPKMRSVYEMIDIAAPTDSTILLQGASGTGKELVARAIHKRSRRAAKPVISVNCGALSETLLESELFGHEKGSFTTAVAARKGLFETANEGTVFLDEIAEMTMPMQTKLLRVLANGEITRVGATEVRKVDVRIIAATHVDLLQAVEAGRFRKDLFFRLNVIPIRLPLLRERRDDIPLLAHHFLVKYAARNHKAVRSISPEAVEALLAHPWEGNVRELENVIESAVVLSRGEVLELSEFRQDFREQAEARPKPATETRAAGADPALYTMPFNEAKALAVAEFEKSYIEQMLAATDHNISEAARRSGLDRSNFRRVMQRYEDAFPKRDKPVTGGGSGATPSHG
ncbi:MAG: sigma-54 dependent transcriptional regulator [Myxococcota bacterium]